MKTKSRLATLLTLLGILGFMFGAVSCTGISPGTQAKIDQASAKYEATTGVSVAQTGNLLVKWWQDYQQAKDINALLKTDVIRATQASPLVDEVTSAKAVLRVTAKLPPPLNPRPRPSPNDPKRLLALQSH